jgi:hypothetical protein
MKLLTQALGALDERHPLLASAVDKYVEMEPEQWVRKFQAWSQRHANDDLPILSDEAISRESIYEDRGL